MKESAEWYSASGTGGFIRRPGTHIKGDMVMKRMIITAVVLAALICPAVFAEEGFSAKVDIDTNLVQFFHQDLKNDTYVDNAIMPRTDSVYFMRNPNYDDVDLTMGYTDPDGRYGGSINFAFNPVPDKYFTLGDLFGWVRISPYFRGKLGLYTDRVVEKIGGDKDLGVLLFGINNSDLVISTSDSLGLGSAAIGFLPTAIVPLGGAGELNLSGFFAPNEYYLAQKISVSYDQSYGAPTVIPAYATYKFGGALKYLFPEYLTLGAAYRTAHSEAVTSTDIGFISHDFGVYGIVTLPAVEGLKVALGYSGSLVYEDKDSDDQEIRKPLKNAVHADFAYSGIPRLNLGLYNNVSFHTLAKADTIGYIAEADRLNPNLFGDEQSLVLYNEISASYDITDAVTASLMVRNYYASLVNLNGGKGQDYAKDTFIVEALAKYKFTDTIQARGGVKFELNNYGTPLSSQVLQNSNYAVSIPIGVTVSW